MNCEYHSDNRSNRDYHSDNRSRKYRQNVNSKVDVENLCDDNGCSDDDEKYSYYQSDRMSNAKDRNIRHKDGDSPVSDSRLLRSNHYERRNKQEGDDKYRSNNRYQSNNNDEQHNRYKDNRRNDSQDTQNNSPKRHYSNRQNSRYNDDSYHTQHKNEHQRCSFLCCV